MICIIEGEPGPKETVPGERFAGRLPEGAGRRARGVTPAQSPGSGRARPPGGRIAPARGGLGAAVGAVPRLDWGQIRRGDRYCLVRYATALDLSHLFHRFP